MDNSLKDLAAMVGKGEKVLWYGKPDKKCFLLECVFNPLLPFALVWLVFDSVFIFAAAASKDPQAQIGVSIFMLLHLMPVWIYLGGILTSTIKYNNTAYIVTTKAIYVSGGVFAKTYEMKPFTDLSHINIHRGIFDQYLGVGDVVSSCSHPSYNAKHSHSHYGITICDIPDYQKVFKLVKDLQTDVYSDTMYPNALRPEENTGYNTQYNKYKEIDIDNN